MKATEKSKLLLNVSVIIIRATRRPPFVLRHGPAFTPCPQPKGGTVLSILHAR
jgi:hypothetical protein